MLSDFGQSFSHARPRFKSFFTEDEQAGQDRFQLVRKRNVSVVLLDAGGKVLSSGGCRVGAHFQKGLAWWCSRRLYGVDAAFDTTLHKLK